MDKVLHVKNGTIYTKNGNGIDNMAVIIDKTCGLLKYGDVDRGFDGYYNELICKYKQAGLEDFCNDWVYIKLDRYDGILDINEICTLVNYMIMCSANGDRLMQILNMNEKDLKDEIKKLKSFGY